jgi:amidase
MSLRLRHTSTMDAAQLDDFAGLDATAQAALVQRREVPPDAPVRAAIARIERLDPALGAVVIPLFEPALRSATDSCQGPLARVPFLLKDLGATEAGQPFYAGNAALRDAGYRSRKTSELAARFRRAGLIPVGKSKTSEFGLQSTTQPIAFGPTRNPWDLARSPGGSSGGACAAVAAGLVPIAHASDGGGSVRIPAAWCGLLGLKPSRGRVTFDSGVGHASIGFAVAHTVRDVAALLDAVRNDASDALIPPPASYLRELERDLGPLRVGLLWNLPGIEVHPECRAAVLAAGRQLQALGCHVEEGHPAALLEEERKQCGWVYGIAEYRSCLRWLARMLGRPVSKTDVEPFLWELADFEGPEIAPEVFRDLGAWGQGWLARMAEWWEGFDLLVTPTVREPALRLDELDAQCHPLPELLDRMVGHMAFTEPFNASGNPALSLPLHRTPEGLPVGVQLIAALGREDLLLRTAAHLHPRVVPSLAASRVAPCPEKC